MPEKRDKKQVELFYTPNRINGDLAVYQYGHHRCPKSHFYGPCIREYYLFHFIVKGKGIYRCGNKEFSLQKGKGFLIKPGDESFYQADRNDPWEYYFVAFHGTVASNIILGIDWVDGCIFESVNEETVRRCMKNICKENRLYPWSEFKVLGELYVLLSEMMKQKSTISGVSSEKNDKSELETAVTYIKENASSDSCRVSDIAKHINMDRTSLYRLFKKNFGISVLQYLRNYRLDQAASLLQYTELPAKTIAVKVGMSNYPHFCKSFKIHNGDSPLDYRKKHNKAKNYN